MAVRYASDSVLDHVGIAENGAKETDIEEERAWPTKPQGSRSLDEGLIEQERKVAEVGVVWHCGMA